jgi:hypothetical protein
MQQGKTYNKTKEGQEALNSRSEIERTNNELKHHHGLNRPRTRGREKFRITVKMTATVINVKLMVKCLGQTIKNPYVRYKRRQGINPPMPKIGCIAVNG